MSDPTIAQVRDARKKLERSIEIAVREAVAAFEGETSIFVDTVSIYITDNTITPQGRFPLFEVQASLRI